MAISAIRARMRAMAEPRGRMLKRRGDAREGNEETMKYWEASRRVQSVRVSMEMLLKNASKHKIRAWRKQRLQQRREQAWRVHSSAAEVARSCTVYNVVGCAADVLTRD